MRGEGEAASEINCSRWPPMWLSFRHKKRKQLFEEDNPRGVNAEHVRKIRQILALLDAAHNVGDLDLATYPVASAEGRSQWSLAPARELAH
jgi:plasmid maintenance system killer protein